jgi:predicted O-methyltransferase YrrM
VQGHGVADLTVAENQRLKKEVRELRARIEAFESSRWWRLHPRFLLGRVLPSQPRQAIAPTPVAEDDGTTAQFRSEVVARGTFSEDWFTVHIPEWERVLPRFDGRAAHVLELGSFEGLSACFVLWRLPDAQLTCVDTFAGIAGYEAYGIATSELERRFDENVALVDASRVRKLVGTTHEILPRLVQEGQPFELVYVDASHAALDVLADVALSWQLLAPGGVMIFDDYGPTPPAEDPLQHPAPAIDAFLKVVRVEVVSNSRQLIVRKTD